ncbi:MAG: radical SAM protein [Bacteroidetes bacterium]|nr:radical SAM protein [Bacteroidota bacterium]
MPLGLLALAASLRLNNYCVRIYQPWKRLLNKGDYQQVAREVLFNNPKIIGFSTWCISYPTSLKLAQTIKSVEPEIPIVFGGPQASILDRETLSQYSCIDYILRGEADNTIIDLVGNLTNSNNSKYLEKIPGLTYRIPSRKKIKRNEDIGYITEMDTLPIPAYDLIPLNKVIKLDVGRGCPFKCTFCTTSSYFSKSYRVKSVSRIIKEMDYCYKKNGITSFGFAHDMFTLNKKFVFDLCESLKQHYKNIGQKYIWSCSARPDCVTDELLKEMKEAGCTDIFFGIESGSDRIQKKIKKNLKLPDTYKVAETCSKLGIRIAASFMAGFPGETREDLNDTIKAILEISARGAKPQMSLLSFLPDTPLHKTCKDKLKYDGRYSDFSAYIYSKEEQKMISNNPTLFSSFYFLPIKATTRDNLLSLSIMVNDLRDFPDTINMIADYLKNDIKNIFFFKILEDQIQKYRKDKKSGYPEFFCLVNGLCDYITYLEEKGLPVYIRDILLMETTKKSLRIKFIWKQINKPGKGSPCKPQNKIDLKDQLVSTGNRGLISTNYKISSILAKHKEGNLSGAGLHYGQYKYLVAACSEKKSISIRLSEKHNKVMEKLEDMRVIDFFNICRRFMNDREIWKFLRKLIRMGVVEVESNKSE